MVIFHSYVSLPEGIPSGVSWPFPYLSFRSTLPRLGSPVGCHWICVFGQHQARLGTSVGARWTSDHAWFEILSILDFASWKWDGFTHRHLYVYIYVYIYIYIWWRWDGLRLIKIIHTNQNIMVIHMNGMAYVSHMFFSHIHSWDGLAATKCFIQSQDVGSWNQPKAHLVMSKGKWCLKPRLDKKPRKDGGSTKECRGSWCC
jgi:hypothetical protein